MNFQIKISNTASNDFRNLIQSTVYGTKGGMQYRHLESNRRIEEVTNPYFVELQAKNRLLGTINLSKRVLSPNKTLSYYVRYFSFLHSYKSKKTGKRKGQSSSIIKNELNKIFESPPDSHNESKNVFYAYIESQNERSERVTREFGFEKIGQVSTYIFSRIKPKESKQVSVINVKEKYSIIENINRFYEDCYMFHFDNFLNTGNYYTYKVNNQIVAGIQATITRWKIIEIPGLSGKLLIKTLPFIPILKNIFNPENFKFLACDYFFVKKGYESILNEFLEGVLHREKCHTALAWVQSNSAFHSTLQNNINPGPLYKFKKDVPANIIVRYNNFTEEEKKQWREKPIFVTSFDMT